MPDSFSLSYNGPISINNEILFACMTGDYASIVRYANMGANLNLVVEENYSPIIYATQNNYLNIVKILLKDAVKRKIDKFVVDRRDYIGRTPLMLSAMNNNCVMMNYLISHKAKINKIDNFGYTALHFATKYNNFESTKKLLSYSPVFNKKDICGYTPKHWAIKNNNGKILELFNRL